MQEHLSAYDIWFAYECIYIKPIKASVHWGVKTSYRKISQSHKTSRLCVKLITSFYNFAGTSAALHPAGRRRNDNVTITLKRFDVIMTL